MDTITAITGRASTRAFLDKPVTEATITAILDTARWAPSGVDAQPWQVAVVKGQTKQRISEIFLAKFRAGVPQNPDYHYYPDEWHEPYKSRRFNCGMALYGALGIARDDKERRKTVWELNYSFFNAPVGLFFFIDKDLNIGSWMDMGMFIQSVMLAARAHGLETCPQAALSEYPDVIREILAYPPEKLVICGMALGYADYKQPINEYRTTREPVENFTKWYD